ncbi:unnamed protein product [Merluccius merluccius]
MGLENVHVSDDVHDVQRTSDPESWPHWTQGPPAQRGGGPLASGSSGFPSVPPTEVAPQQDPAGPPRNINYSPSPVALGPLPSMTPGVSESGGEGSKVVLSTAMPGISQKFPAPHLEPCGPAGCPCTHMT